MTNQIIISNTSIHQDTEGRYSLNDLHKAAGCEQRHQPRYWLALDQTNELIEEILNSGISLFSSSPTNVKKGRYGGTYVCKELVYSYAMWISAAFALKVIRAYDDLVSGLTEHATSKTTVDERTPLRDAVNMLVSKKHLMYPEAYAIIHQRFNVESIEDLATEQLPMAVEYVHRLVLEGEFLGKKEALPAPTLNLPEISMQWWYENNFPMRRDNLPRHPGHQPWSDLTLSPAMMYGADTKSPALFLIETLEMMGFDLTGPRIEVETMRIMLRKGKGNVRVCGAGNVKHLLAL